MGIIGYKIYFILIAPSVGNFDATEKFRNPRNMAEVLQLLSLTNLFSRFIPSFAMRKKPLFDTLHGTGFSQEEEKSCKN